MEPPLIWDDSIIRESDIMKRVCSLFLAGLLLLPAYGCAAPAAKAAQAPQKRASSAAAPEESPSVSARLTELYQISFDSTEQSLAALSSEIGTLPVQPRPLAASAEAACDHYAAQVIALQENIDEYRAQVNAEIEKHDLTKEDADALLFQCDQMDTRTETLRSTLCVVYGLPAA